MGCLVDACLHSVQNLTGSVKGYPGSDPPYSPFSANRRAGQVEPVLLQAGPFIEEQDTCGRTSRMARQPSV